MFRFTAVDDLIVREERVCRRLSDGVTTTTQPERREPKKVRNGEKETKRKFGSVRPSSESGWLIEVLKTFLASYSLYLLFVRDVFVSRTAETFSSRSFSYYLVLAQSFTISHSQLVLLVRTFLLRCATMMHGRKGNGIVFLLSQWSRPAGGQPQEEEEMILHE